MCHSDFIWDFRKLPLPSHLGKYFIKISKISAKIHEIGKTKAFFGLGSNFNFNNFNFSEWAKILHACLRW